MCMLIFVFFVCNLFVKFIRYSNQHGRYSMLLGNFFSKLFVQSNFMYEFNISNKTKSTFPCKHILILFFFFHSFVLFILLIHIHARTLSFEFSQLIYQNKYTKHDTQKHLYPNPKCTKISSIPLVKNIIASY